MDPSGRFTDDTGQIRNGLTSSVDLSTMLVSLGNLGTRDWMKGYLKRMYGDRHDMISMLKSAKAPGREYVLYATDEVTPDIVNFNRSPTHVLGLRTEDTKTGVYADWLPLTSQIIPRTVDLEFYDYSTQNGRLELDNLAEDPRARQAYRQFVRQIIPNELQEPLPPALRFQQEKSKIAHILYREYVSRKPIIDWIAGDLRKVLGYGGMF